jgi:predicted SprT family Zn-dependent metalloprotease
VSKAEVTFKWEDDGCAGIDKIKCACGHIHDGRKDAFDTVCAGDVWECPECHKKITFKWHGMVFEEMEK